MTVYRFFDARQNESTIRSIVSGLDSTEGDGLQMAKSLDFVSEHSRASWGSDNSNSGQNTFDAKCGRNLDLIVRCSTRFRREIFWLSWAMFGSSYIGPLPNNFFTTTTQKVYWKFGLLYFAKRFWRFWRS